MSTLAYLAMPKRALVLAAKAVVAVGIGSLFGLVAGIISTGIGLIFVVAHRDHVALSAGFLVGHLAEAVAGAALLAGLGVAVGSLIRPQLATVIGVFVLAIIIESVIGGLYTSVHPYLDRYLDPLVADLRPYSEDPSPARRCRSSSPTSAPSTSLASNYRHDRVKDRYLEMLEPDLATGLPVVVSELGMRTCAGASTDGALGFGITDTASVVFHQLFGGLVRLRNKSGYVRDEAGQATELDETLSILEDSAVAGWFLASFSTPDTLLRRRPAL